MRTLLGKREGKLELQLSFFSHLTVKLGDGNETRELNDQKILIPNEISETLADDEQRSIRANFELISKLFIFDLDNKKSERIRVY